MKSDKERIKELEAKTALQEALLLEVAEDLKLYANPKHYSSKKSQVDIHQSSATMKESYLKSSPELSKPRLIDALEYDCSMRIKSDQGQRARECLSKIESHLGGAPSKKPLCKDNIRHALLNLTYDVFFSKLNKSTVIDTLWHSKYCTSFDFISNDLDLKVKNWADQEEVKLAIESEIAKFLT